jgi:hypothetical protein
MTQDQQPLPPSADRSGRTDGGGRDGPERGSERIVRLHPAAPAADAAMAATDDDPAFDELPRSRRLPLGWSLGWSTQPATRGWQPPVSGALAAIFGTAALFKLPLVLAPLAIALALIAGWRGHHAWAVIGLGTGLVGLLTSAWFWTLLGLAWLYQSWG